LTRSKGGICPGRLLYLVVSDVANYEHPDREIKEWRGFRDHAREAALRFKETGTIEQIRERMKA
jgi:hypothetical protein